MNDASGQSDRESAERRSAASSWLANRHTAGRLVRLCMKELREILRDRRTIVTLVLMPLLVYPLLSILFNKLLSMPRNSAGRHRFPSQSTA